MLIIQRTMRPVLTLVALSVLVTLDLRSSSSAGLLVCGCGVTIHNEVAFRASQLLLSSTPDFGLTDSLGHDSAHSQAHSANAEPDLTKKSSNALLRDYAPLLEKKELLFAGSFFPDWGYNCIGKLWNDAAEEAHWPPFTKAAIKYILEVYPKPWTDHTKELIAFLFGAVSHQLGDMSWHALRGLDAGFIGVLAETSFDGDYGKGHTLADIGAEFVLSHMGKMNHLLTSWKVPVKDITEIYKRMGYNVPGMVLTHCMKNGFAGAQANARLGSQLFPVYASKSPFLVEQILNYPMGGLHDMTEWTVDCWSGLAEYLEESRVIPPGETHRNSTFNLCYALSDQRMRKREGNSTESSKESQMIHQHEDSGVGNSGGISSRLRLQNAGMDIHTSIDADTGMVTFQIDGVDGSMLPDAPDPIDALQKSQEQSEQDIRQDQTLHSPPQQQQRQQTFWSRPPQESGRYKVTRSSISSNPCVTFSDEVDSQAQILYLPIPYSSFGRAVVTGDFDHDGSIDVAIGAPHLSTDPLIPSQGSVFVVPSSSIFNGEGVHHNGNTEESGIDVRTIASRILQGDPTEPQSRFGWSLAVVDLNQDGIDDLAVGAPGRGAKDLRYDGTVFVYFGHAKTGLSLEPDLIISHDRELDDNGWLIPQGASTLAGLGYLVQGVDLTGSGFKDLVLAMPMATIPIERPRRGGPKAGDQRASGIGEDDRGEYYNEVHGDDEDSQKFYFKRHAGKVAVFLSKAGHTGPRLDSQADWELHGNDSFGWFGSSLAVVSQNLDQNVQAATMPKISNWLRRAMSWLNPLNTNGGRTSSPTSSRKILVVSSPTFGVGEKEAMRGKLQGFVIPEFKDTVALDPKQQPIFTIHGDIKFQQLGSQLATTTLLVDSDTDNGDSYDGSMKKARMNGAQRSDGPSKPKTEDLLIVGSQSEEVLHRLPMIGWQWQAGKVRVLDLAKIPDGTDISISTLDRHPERIVRDSLQGSQSMAHLSAAMQVSRDGKSLWLAEPYAKSEAGRIVEWEPDYRTKESTGGGRKPGRRWPRWPRWPGGGGGGGDGGGADSHNGGGDGDDDDDDGGDNDRIRQCFFGSDYRGRFGSQLLITDLDRSGLDTVVVTSSHASQYATMAGTVTIKRLS